MKWSDAKALIEEIRKLRCKKGYLFLERLEQTQPATLVPTDKDYLLDLYRYAAGGGPFAHYHHSCNHCGD